ncbi:MAG: phosphoenolpyruvate synthase, partial [Clostridia bacterium]|nr:phosphoenolpyruvate synthase [Clostridia bacterium]
LYTDIADRQQFSQRIVDAVSEKAGDVEGFDAVEISGAVPGYLKRLMYSHNTETENIYRERGDWREVLFVTCDGLTRNSELMADMRDILALIQKHYEYPVDTEYTINFAPDGSYMIDLLQCRPLQLTAEGDRITVPDSGNRENVLLETKGVSMGFSRELEIDAAVYIDPIQYYQMPYRRKYEIKDALAKVNWHYRGQGRHLLLLTPGRICTSSPELGVPSGFSDISEFAVIAEVSESRAGYIPELSYGSHIFQDLVEAGIMYTAVFEKDSTLAYSPGILKRFRDVTEELAPLPEDISGVFRVYETGGSGLTLYYDMAEEHLLIRAE